MKKLKILKRCIHLLTLQSLVFCQGNYWYHFYTPKIQEGLAFLGMIHTNKRQIYTLDDSSLKFVFYHDEFSILPTLSKCSLVDFGIKEYEELGGQIALVRLCFLNIFLLFLKKKTNNRKMKRIYQKIQKMFAKFIGICTIFRKLVQKYFCWYGAI